MQKKTVEDMLTEFIQEPEAQTHMRNYAVFLERWDEIRSLHEERGWPYRKIWKAMCWAGAFSMSQSTFYKNVHKMAAQEKRQEVIQQNTSGGANASKGKVKAVPDGSGSSPTRLDMPLFPRKDRDPGKF